MTNILIGGWFVIVGIIALVKPGFFFQSGKLTPEKVARNTRIWRWSGLGLIVAGGAILIIQFLLK